MTAAINWLQEVVRSVPLPVLEVWGRCSYLIGLALAVWAFGGFTFRLGDRWGFGRERQAWDEKAFVCIPLTFVLIVLTGYVGSFVVLVPGAQTFESLKDLIVLLCVVLFGYPALIIVPFAYGLSDLIEGVPPDFILDWLPGYFINPACFWLAYQLFGKDPDFRRARTWGRYLTFVLVFMVLEPVLWGFICSNKFTSEISYRAITPALLFTTTITWIIGPFAMLAALPLARRFGLFWAEIPGHVRERRLGGGSAIWEAGRGEADEASGKGLPIRMFILAPFIALLLVMIGATAYVALRSAEGDANRLAARLHREISSNLKLTLDDYLASVQRSAAGTQTAAIVDLLRSLPIAADGRAFIIERSGMTRASSVVGDDAVATGAIEGLRRAVGGLGMLDSAIQFRFDLITPSPSRETWLVQATPYPDGSGDWIVITAMPEAFYLAGVREGNSRSAMVFALALLLCLAVAAVLASTVTAPLRRLSTATRALARGDLTQRVPGSRIEELGVLAESFNDMAEQLNGTFDMLEQRVTARTAELHTKNEELEQQISERQRVAELLRSRNEELKAFAYTVSHDLKAPLRGIAGYAQELDRRHGAGFNERARFCLNQILTATHNLDRLIEDLLHYSRLDAETPIPADIDLPGLLDAILSDRKPAILEHHAEVSRDLSVTRIRSWERGLSQVLTNLIDNALKYSRDASPPRVRVSSREDSDAVRIIIADNGIGFDLKYHDRIFGLFNRLVRQEDFEGTGAGLAIVKKVTEKMGGRIWAESKPGSGATFILELPGAARQA